MRKRILISTVLFAAMIMGGCSNNSDKRVVESVSTTEEVITQVITEQVLTSEEMITEETTEILTEIDTEEMTETTEEITEAVTEEVVEKVISDILLNNKFYMIGIQDAFYIEYTFLEDGSCIEQYYTYEGIINENQRYTQSYIVDEKNKTVSIIDAQGEMHTYYYIEELGGFRTEVIINENDPMLPARIASALMKCENISSYSDLSPIWSEYINY